MRNRLTDKQLFYIVLAISFVLVFILNYLTPLLADDYSYSFGLNGKVNSLKDIFDYQVHHYLNWGGRSVVHFIAQFFLMFNKMVFNVCNSLVYVLFTYLIYRHSSEEKTYKPSLLIIINMLLWFSLPVFGQNILWLIGSCNYLWGSTIILAFLLYFKRNLDHSLVSTVYKATSLFVFGVLAGWTNENAAAGLLFILIGFFLYRLYFKNKIYLFHITGFIGTLIGFAILLIAPGNYIREKEIEQTGSFIYKIFYNFLVHTGSLIDFLLPLIIFFLVITLLSYFHGKNDLKNGLKTLIYFLASIISVYSMVLSPVFPERAWFCVITYMIIAISIAFQRLDLNDKLVKIFINMLTLILIISFLFNYIRAVRENYKIKKAWNNRIQYIEEEKKNGSLDITVEEISTEYKYASNYLLIDLDYDKWKWPNTSVSKYFEVKSIKLKK